jgi:flagellar M-ring protein FliF
MPQRVTLVMFIVGSVVIFAAISLFSRGADYQVIFAGLTPEDAAAISNRLRDDHIPFQYDTGRGAVLVPAGRINEARQILVAVGLPKGDAVKGYELFNDIPWGQPEFIQRVNKQRAMIGDLENRIGRYNGVAKASVVFSVPDDDPFTRSARNAKATVTLMMKSGKKPNRGLISTIRHTVAAADPKLDLRNVAVMDADGNVYAGFQMENDAMGMTGEQLTHQAQVENYWTDKAQSLLDEVLGPNRAVVRVAAELNFDATVKETIRMADPLTKQRMVSTDKSKNYTPNVGGPVGAAETKPGTVTGDIRRSTVSVEADKKETTEVYDTGATETKEVVRVEQQMGLLKRLTVAVMIAKGEKARTDEEKTELEEAVKQAVGFVERRDRITLKEVEFPKEEAPAEAGGLALGDYQKLFGEYGPTLAAVFGLLVLLVVFAKLMRRLTAPPPALELAVRSMTGAAAMAHEERIDPRVLAAEQAKKQVEVTKTVMDNAEQATQIIRSLLK